MHARAHGQGLCDGSNHMLCMHSALQARVHVRAPAPPPPARTPGPAPVPVLALTAALAWWLANPSAASATASTGIPKSDCTRSDGMHGSACSLLLLVFGLGLPGAAPQTPLPLKDTWLAECAPPSALMRGARAPRKLFSPALRRRAEKLLELW